MGPGGGGGGAGGPVGIVLSFSGYGGTTGMLCIVLLESEDCSDNTDTRDESRWALNRRGDCLAARPLRQCFEKLFRCDEEVGNTLFDLRQRHVGTATRALDREQECQLLACNWAWTWGSSRARQGHKFAHVEHILTSRFILREPVDCTDLAEALDVRACSAGEMERTGTLGGGPGSAPGERRWAKARWEPDDGACMAVYAV
ncbi:hypothetical protein HG530_000981 [Fusarium avenaceum]|nr:hypothetical protein HG530_000981 [Fusarium avenaceum]